MSYAYFELQTKFVMQHFNSKLSGNKETQRRPDVLKVARIIKNVKRIISDKNSLSHEQARNLLRQWDELIDKETIKTKNVGEEIETLLQNDHDIVITDIKNKPERFDVYWNDQLVWKIIRMMLLIDKTALLVGISYKTAYFSRDELERFQKKLAAPLRRTLGEIVFSSKELFQIKEQKSLKEVVA